MATVSPASYMQDHKVWVKYQVPQAKTERQHCQGKVTERRCAAGR